MSLDLALALLANAATAINAAGVALEQLRDAPPTEAVPLQPVDGGVCRHPKEKRISTATHGNPTGWMCGVCQFEGSGDA